MADGVSSSNRGKGAVDSDGGAVPYRASSRRMWDDYAGLPPFRRKHASDHNLTDADVRRLLAHGVICRLAHGLLVGARRLELVAEDVDGLRLRVQAMQRRYPIGRAAYRTAAALHGLWLVGPSGPVHLVRVKGRQREKYDVWVETADLPAEDRCVVLGIESTSMARTAVDLACRLPPPEALAVVDSALRLGTSIDELWEVAARRGVEAGSLAAEVIGIADARSESALESMSRWQFHAAGIEPPELQVVVGDVDGDFARVDFFWRRQRVVGEADGLLKYDEDPLALRAEKTRQERLERTDATVVRWGWADVTDQPADLIRRVKDALRKGERRNSGAA
jgi:hypothetical protein